MIQKTKYYFEIDNFTSDYFDAIEETKQIAREYKKNNDIDENCRIFCQETFYVFGKDGTPIYYNKCVMREFMAEDEVNNIEVS